MQFNHLALGCGKHLAILALATRIPTAIGAAGANNWVRGIGYSPVVRQIYVDGLAIVCELPAVIEQLVCLCRNTKS